MYENHANIWRGVAEASPGKTALVAGEARYDYGSFDLLASKAAGALSARGVVRGDVVGFYLHNTAEFLIAFYACLKLGATPAPMNYRYRAREVVELVGIVSPAVMLYRASAREEALQAQELLAEQQVGTWIEVDDEAYAPAAQGPGPVGAVLFWDFVEGAEPLESLEADPAAELYIFTGGTTGRPKAVVWGIGALMDVQGTSTYPPIGLEIPTSLGEAVRVAAAPETPHVTTLPLAPFIHATALLISTNTLNVGGTVVLYPSPSLKPAAAAGLVVRERVTQLVVAGDAVAIPLVEALEDRRSREPLRISTVLSSGMRFSDETKARLHNLGEVTILDILASSEGGPYAMGITRSAGELPARFQLTPDAVVLDERDRQMQDQFGAKGVLAFRGALPKGYLNEPKKSQETYPEIDGVRHVRPGDYVEVQNDRYIEFLGRGSAVINSGGEKIFPAEVEEALLEHDAVTDAVVFGLPDDRMGERVSAVVAVTDPDTVTGEGLRDWVGAKLAGYKKPRTIVVRGSLERTPAGKVNMPAMKETVRAALFSSRPNRFGRKGASSDE